MFIGEYINKLIKSQNMKDIKITIPDNCELIKEGDSYIVKERSRNVPRSWKEFCENFPIKPGEYFIDTDSDVLEHFDFNNKRKEIEDRVLCINKKEAEAFLALMQLRQLRKAWIGDWEQPKSSTKIGVVIHNINYDEIVADNGNYWTTMPLSFPTKEMAEDFIGCFRDLCKTAKILL